MWKIQIVQIEQTWLRGEGDPLELCNKLKFHRTDKWYMLKPDAV